MLSEEYHHVSSLSMKGIPVDYFCSCGYLREKSEKLLKDLEEIDEK